jgi:transcriptional regulator with XRE-family HTH domain
MKDVKINPLRMARVLKGLSQTELSFRARVSQVRISQIENHHWIPNETELRKLAQALGTSPEKIFSSKEK